MDALSAAELERHSVSWIPHRVFAWALAMQDLGAGDVHVGVSWRGIEPWGAQAVGASKGCSHPCIRVTGEAGACSVGAAHRVKG